jgi:hypothetical protein
MDVQTSSASGLYKRQPSSAASVEEGRAPANHPNNTSEMEIDAGCENSSGSSGVSLLSAPDGSPLDSASQSSSSIMNPIENNINCFVYGHIAWSALFFVAGSSLVPLFAAVEDESWRTLNIPYQKTAAGDIILDFQLNKPLVDPPTVPCTYASICMKTQNLILILALMTFLFLLFYSWLIDHHFHCLSCAVCAFRQRF